MEEYIEVGDFDSDVLFPNGALEMQKVLNHREEVIDGFASLVEGAGSEFVPGEGALKMYHENKEAE